MKSLSPNNWRVGCWLLLIVVGLWTALPGARSTTLAQDDADETATDDAPVEKGAAKSDRSAEPEAAPAGEKNMLIWLIETSGWIGAVLLVLSLYFVATVVRMFMELRPEIAAPPALIEECEALLKNKDYLAVYKRLKNDPSFFATVLSAGMTELPHGLSESRETMDRVGDALVVEMERKISMLAVLGSLGPMIGLLGTLKGMIASFSVIALSDTQLKASQVAGGISEALVLTFEGVGLSVPAIYFFAVFRNRVSSISTSTMLVADEFVRRLNALVRGKAPTAGGPSPTAPTNG
ncbi:MAG TPA: MotA/TolQ/ExbB proton channel family protein [Planctomycetaceae bacterium]|jgi:biopolymer transport protein ExbB|nr:MotA/TolQ/ExbB proton channel family protein [Planctomycetaceae bacterium]